MSVKHVIDDMKCNYVILGASGSIGRMLVGMLESNGCSCVTGVDVGSSWSPCIVKGDILRPDTRVTSALSNANVVVSALSNEVLSSAMDVLLKYTSSDCALIDTLSIKSSYAEVVSAYRGKIGLREVAGINPMFSGDLDPAGRPVAVVQYDGFPYGVTCRRFFDILNRTGARIVEMDPISHDRSMATLQVLVHAGVMAFGRALCDERQDIDTLLTLAPPPFRVMLALVARMTCNRPEVYWEIQRDNPFSDEVRKSLIDSMNCLDGVCKAGDVFSFRDIMESMAQGVVEPRPDLVHLSRRMFGFLG